MADFKKKCSKKKVLGPMRRCLDPEAVENIGLRRFCRRIKSITGHFLNGLPVCDSSSAPSGYSQSSQTYSTSTSQTTACLASRLPIRPSASHVSVNQMVNPIITSTASLRLSSRLPLCTPAPVSVPKERFSAITRKHTAQARLRGHDFFQSFPSDLPQDLLPPDIWTSSQTTYNLSMIYSSANIIHPVKGFYQHQIKKRDSLKTHDTVLFKKLVTDLGWKSPIVATTDVSHELNDNDDESLASGLEVWFDAADMLEEIVDIATSPESCGAYSYPSPRSRARTTSTSP